MPAAKAKAAGRRKSMRMRKTARHAKLRLAPGLGNCEKLGALPHG